LVTAIIGLGILGLLAFLPLLALIALARIGRLGARLRELEARFQTLETRLSALVKTTRTERSETAAEPLPVAPKVATVPAAAAPIPPEPLPPKVPTVAPAAAASIPPEPLPPKVPTSPAAPEPPFRAPRPETKPPEPKGSVPTPPRTPPFDWESLLGLKGAAWAGGTALVIAALLLAKLAIEKGVITPELRVVLMLGTGVASLVWAEVSLRKGYATTANAVSGAGIAILYVALFAAHALYHLFSLPLTFALMALVTGVAGLVAVRYDALFTALLGLLGGFATPVLLSTGEDHPIGLFSYILLLNVGLLAVVRQRGWPALTLLSCLATLFMEIGWFATFMAPEKLAVGLSIFLIFGLFYLAFAVGQSETLGVTAALGGLAPFLFALILASSPRYSPQWPLLFAFVGLLDAGLAAFALARDRVGLLVSGAVATSLTLFFWGAVNLGRGSPWGPTISAIVLVALLNALPRLAGALGLHRGSALEAVGLVSACGLGLFAALLVVKGGADPPWPFLLLTSALAALLLERSGRVGLPGVRPAGALAVAILIQLWFFASPSGEGLVRNLSIPLLFAILLFLASGSRGEAEAAGVLAASVAILGLFGCLITPGRGSNPTPLFTALAVAALLLLIAALRRDWRGLIPLGLVASALLATVWHQLYFHVSDLGVVLPFEAGFYIVFLALPFVVPGSVAPRWEEQRTPWVSSALSGPVFFPAIYWAVTAGWGKAWIGALPLAMAGLSLAALAAVARRFPAAGTRRLDHLALFAALTLGFIALAIPLQLERQWITVGWALEAAACWWLLRKLPHPGLKLFGTALYAAVGVRLLLNPEVLRYEPRSSLPIVNWLLYTYGVPALCCLFGASFLRRAERARGGVAAVVSVLGLVLIFCLINLEIADYFSQGRFVEFSFERQMDRDLTMSVAWGLYAMTLLVIGVWRRIRALRLVGLAFLSLTVGKVFLFDLSNLTGVYRILSFLGLAVSLILVSLLYQRFVLVKEAAR
jgi:uncharacterized membrane protein